MLQVALDRMKNDDCVQLVSDCHPYIDIVEVGTGVIKEYGMEIVREMKKRFPDKCILADMKTCDAGKHEALQAFEAGADYTTVMGFSADKTILDTLRVSEDFQKEVVIDLLGITSADRIHELKHLGVTAVSVHIGKDMQADEGSFDVLTTFINALEGLKISVAGGINPDNIASFSKIKPDIYIVGSFITGSKVPSEAAKEIRGQMKK
ncbi:orotidine 5'-phosphate decarboxylase [Aquibacillus sp. 3ASR75-11]|uniref:3-hexulose-6-phosphate synthase n=1 Tax=Terrihalobacillus insolitus TaxID=2950438 RepID=A0A9X4AKM3_9BACI|nr:3-hexulose-6-phosphate synthase [Terrihalobacillus insolitus]MDC3412056.1 orotidine 5'-phosphate decarboxylase [Terrihalobacillus insolitus]MDC3423251.1 orotidine 5'-phosphate decarboxylase [Terrihalobacillus insolitus]